MDNRYRKADAYEVRNSLTGEAFDPAQPIYIAIIKDGGSASSDGLLVRSFLNRYESDSLLICISEEQLNAE